MSRLLLPPSLRDLSFRPMRPEDLDQVMAIERASFSLPWPRQAYLYELRDMGRSRLFVVEDRKGVPPEVVAYAGYWRVVDEAHITNVAVRADHRGRGVGTWLMERLLETASEEGLMRATLEVRVSNLAAQHLYERLGFTGVAIRRGYYTDNGENALVMWKERLEKTPEGEEPC
ncbi:MAG: ribosomal protein S18-alanine N-acetyltransferase [Nitrospinota bacterium]